MGLMAQVDRARSTLQSANDQLSEARELLGLPKQEAPKEPEEKGFFGKLKDNLSDIGHTVLDVAGLVPVIGAPADALNGVWYAAEGDWVNAGLSAAGIIPFVGEAAVAGKLGAKGIDAVRTADNAMDVAEAGGGARATFGNATSTDYRRTFLEAHPEIDPSKVTVHHAVEQQVLKPHRYPDLVSEAEMHSLENLRGIPNEINSDVHQSQIRKEWNRFYAENSITTKEQLLEKATEIDNKFGHLFTPPIR